MQRTLCSFQWFGAGADRALGELGLGHAGEALEVVVARIAEVGRPKAEVDSDRAAVAALVLQEVCTMFGAHLRERESESERK